MKTYTLMEAIPFKDRERDREIWQTKLGWIAHLVRRYLQSRVDRRELDIVYYVKDY